MPATENTACTEAAEQTSASVDPPEALLAPPDGEPIAPALRLVCPAASHQLLWQWRVGAWQCPACGT